MPLDYGADAPAYYRTIPMEEREKRVVLEKEICIVDDEEFFIHGCIDIPIIDSDADKIFSWVFGARSAVKVLIWLQKIGTIRSA